MISEKYAVKTQMRTKTMDEESTKGGHGLNGSRNGRSKSLPGRRWPSPKSKSTLDIIRGSRMSMRVTGTTSTPLTLPFPKPQTQSKTRINPNHRSKFNPPFGRENEFGSKSNNDGSMLTSNVEGSNVKGSKVGVDDGSKVGPGVGVGIDIEGKFEHGRERDESAELVLAIWLLLALPVILVEVKANAEVRDTFFPVSMIVPTPSSVDSCPTTETPSPLGFHLQIDYRSHHHPRC